ncbi:MAG: extracellular catalytic domain type 1 short-chain-length polyhydroxyalkanoate depolymerase [Dehalococcoidia bacterium]
MNSRARRCVACGASVAALLVVSAVAFAACSGGSPSKAAATATGAPAPASSSSPVAMPSPPCSPVKPHAAGSTGVTIQSGGISRHYILHVPPSYDGTRELPLVVNLHGAGSNALQQAFYSGFQKKADAEGFITVTPDATGKPQAWNFIPIPGGADDVGFIRDALDRTEAALCVDPARVYATGISSGAAMAVRLACSLQDRIDAIGVVAALWYPPDCPTAKPMPVLEFHGTLDPLVPFGGGTVANSGIPAPSVEGAAAAWAKADGCEAVPAKMQLTAHVRTLAYSECRGYVAVELFIVEGGGHTWPGAAVDVTALGETTHEINATDEIWQFFIAQMPGLSR